MEHETVRKHPYHMVEPSPWPFMGTVGAFVTAVGAVWFMHAEVPWGLGLGISLLVLTMIGWWHDVIREAAADNHTSVVRKGLRVGMILFIASEVMFFLAFFWAFFHSSMPAFSLVAPQTWPPEDVEILNPWGIPFVNTLILLASGFAVTWAHHTIRKDNKAGVVAGLTAAVVLGFVFLGLQAYEYGVAAFGFEDGIYSSTFYMATGFHGFHVSIGVLLLLIFAWKVMRGQYDKSGDYTSVEIVGLYWHFVDLVWVFIFAFFYLW